MTEKLQVFVYGTLLKGEYNNYLLEESELKGDASITGFVMHCLGSYPAITPVEGADVPVLGEVWEITPETFARLDRLEGYPHFYDRVEVETPFGTAWAYFIEDIEREEPANVILSGSWRQHRSERRWAER